MDAGEIRERFLTFFEERGHRRYDSVPLIPQDPTLLLTIAGMVPFKSWFMGDSAPAVPRATSHQRCVRTNDIENVGRTTRHLSMFEMLGNFSFGDYFKREAIAWAWELATTVYGFDPERIWATVYEGDEDSEQLWLDETDVPAARIQRLGNEDNFWWTHNAGPGGPNTELFYDRGEAFGEPGGPAVNDERYLEFYNCVFMQYAMDDDGNIIEELPNQNVDTGMGLERMAVLLQDAPDVFGTDVLRPMVERAVEVTGVTYGADDRTDVSLRVVAEHARTSAFLIGDGVLPAKEGRGYVLRRMLRRAVRHAHLLDFDGDIIGPMVDQVIATMGPLYPFLEHQRELITRVAGAEQADFQRRLGQGMELVDEAIATARDGDSEQFPGETAFRLHDTHGFPIDLTIEIVEDAGLTVDRDAFDELMVQQQERARAAAKKSDDGIDVDVRRQAARALGGPVEFVGYDTTEADAELAALLAPGGLLDAAQEGDEIEVALPRTPFYAEGGGQVGDRGTIETDSGRLEVLDTQEVLDGLVIHRARVVAGEIAAGQAARATVDRDRRLATARSHSATHVLHATMKDVLGSHAQQAGSHVEPGRLRFDFPHFDSLKGGVIEQIEETINVRVLRDPAVTTEVMDIESAKAAGAVANFGDKYGDIVRVVTIGDFSKELCGGTHVHSGATIGTIHIVREESIGSNTRRVEALTGMDAFRYAVAERMVAEEVARLFDTSTDQVVQRVTDLVERLRATERELGQLRAAGIAAQARQLADDAERTDGLAVVTAAVDGLAGDDLRSLAQQVRNHLAEQGIVVVGATTADGKAQLVGAVTGDLVDAGIEARPIVHPAAQLVGGGAGGAGDLAQAGGRDGSRLVEALELAAATARELAGA
ncbi:MAG: alanine--tRNA ligase [Nitriliruptorales bacterium]|nr:alanine--tRNA ligase [Nitriliruptorales bacterium]